MTEEISPPSLARHFDNWSPQSSVSGERFQWLRRSVVRHWRAILITDLLSHQSLVRDFNDWGDQSFVTGAPFWLLIFSAISHWWTFSMTEEISRPSLARHFDYWSSQPSATGEHFQWLRSVPRREGVTKAPSTLSVVYGTLIEHTLFKLKIKSVTDKIFIRHGS